MNVGVALFRAQKATTLVWLKKFQLAGVSIIGASVSEPHTSEFNAAISVCLFVSYVMPKWGPPVPVSLEIWGPGSPKSLGIWGPRGRETLAIWGSFSDLGTPTLSALNCTVSSMNKDAKASITAPGRF